MEQVEVKYAPGMRIIVRGEEWMVKKVETNSLGNQTLHVIGLSQLVKDYESMFLVDIEDDIEIVDPAKVTLVPDNSAFFRKSKVYIESQWRGKIPTDNKIHIGNKAAMDLMSYQLEPAQMALNKTRQRILIADTVGLGKTLEAGILMSELIARGKGKRILVVTVKSMMTQFQKEMWNRFTIPLVRLDSSRIQSVRAKLPTNYNPFFYYDKTIISVDTLKNDLDYRTHLEHAWWDIIVIDEAHNVAKRGDRSSQRSKLASLLANRSDTLIMLTATPHDGKGQSVASLMNMLDPTAIADEENYTKDDIEGLLIRRFKKDIQDQVSGAFKERVITIERCAASAREEAAYDIFADMKLQMDESNIDDSYVQRMNYSPATDINSYLGRLSNTEWGNKYNQNYRVISRKMLNLSGERSLISCISVPDAMHTNGILGLACPECMEIMFDEPNRTLCSNGHKTIPIWVPDLKTEGRNNSKAYKCPFCNGKGTMSFIGLRSATAISAGISELYASKFNDDKKLLAFTDNVQDAAHHAGFYNSRTWKFGLRTAITQFINNDSEEYSFDEFIQRVVSYWKNYLGDDYFVANFIPANLTWMRAYERMCNEGTLRKDEDAATLLSFVEQRFKYEILMEYGILSRIGRTLEKAGCSVLSFEYEKAIPGIMERVANEVGRLQSTDAETFTRMVLGVLYQMKTNGAFTYYAFEQFINNGANYYHLSNERKKWLPGVNRGLNVPKFVAINRGSKKLKGFDGIESKSWYSKWINKYLPMFSLESDSADIMKIILEELTKAGVLDKIETPDNIDVWSINPEKCKVTSKVKQLVCDECGTQISMSESDAELFDGACCTRNDCNGHMHIAEDKGLDFYGKLYSQGELVRIVAKEHTGLLERDDRENLEREFKKSKDKQKPWDPNLLSCNDRS